MPRPASAEHSKVLLNGFITVPREVNDAEF